jgi:2-phosphosulfolactate phosphatase
VIAACLRNVNAVGCWIAEHGFGTPRRPVTVIAAGERWPDGDLRPALEDLLGAGAVIAAISEYSGGIPSPEAAAARACFAGTADLASAVTDSASGRELAESGFADDVAIAIEINACRVVPVLTDQAFTAGS